MAEWVKIDITKEIRFALRIGIATQLFGGIFGDDILTDENLKDDQWHLIVSPKLKKAIDEQDVAKRINNPTSGTDKSAM